MKRESVPRLHAAVYELVHFSTSSRPAPETIGARRIGAYARVMSAKALELFSAYRSGRVPPGGGYVVSSFMVDGSAYVRYEIVAYRRARHLGLSREGLTFAADASRIFVLVEPDGYPERVTEPFQRDARHRIPHRFAELATVAVRGHSRIMVSRDPVIVSSRFTVAAPSGIDFAFLFLPRGRRRGHDPRVHGRDPATGVPGFRKRARAGPGC